VSRNSGSIASASRLPKRQPALLPPSVQPLIDELLARCIFPEPGTSLACAVSGGADSSALLILAREAGCDVTAHHVDHGLRDGSAAEAQMVAELADRFGATFVAHAAVVEPGPNLEARARTARFALLPAEIATGHTLDDRAETIMINLLRGAARTGLSPMRSDGRHPIRHLRRSETVALCEALAVPVVSDPTNDDLAFLRNRVRHQVLPLLNEVSQRDVAPLLDRQADLLADEDVLLDLLAAEVDATDAKAVAAAPVALARRALRRFVLETWTLGYPPSIDAIERILTVAKGAATSCEIEGGHRVYRTNQRLRLEGPGDNVSPP